MCRVQWSAVVERRGGEVRDERGAARGGAGVGVTAARQSAAHGARLIFFPILVK